MARVLIFGGLGWCAVAQARSFGLLLCVVLMSRFASCCGLCFEEGILSSR